MTQDVSGPITALAAAQQQHLLFLFFPLKKGVLGKGIEAAHEAFNPHSHAASAHANGIDPRVLPGVHFFMFHGVPAGTSPAPAPVVPTFTTAPGKDLLVVMSLYDRDFGPYISAFTSVPSIAKGLNGILFLMDESGIVPDTDPTSAKFILAHGGVAKNNPAFLKLLMRYNFADPTVPAAAKLPPNTPKNPKYALGATFPGLTVGWILQNYPDAAELWPVVAPEINFSPSAPPSK